MREVYLTCVLCVRGLNVIPHWLNTGSTLAVQKFLMGTSTSHSSTSTSTSTKYPISGLDGNCIVRHYTNKQTNKNKIW